MSRLKITTKREAIAAGFYIIQDLMSQDAENENYDFSAEYNGSWCTTTYWLDAAEFELYATRRKHSVGRIRDNRSSLDNILGFIVYCVENFPDRQICREWAEDLLDEKLVRSTMNSDIRKWFVMPKDVTVANVCGEIHSAHTLAKMAS